MSGIVAIFDRGEYVSDDVICGLLNSIDHRGHDGRGAVTKGHVGLGHQHFYTTLEAVGEDQPIGGNGYLLTLDGRIDNRSELINSHSHITTSQTDAEIFLQMCANTSIDTALQEIVGAFDFALWDQNDSRLIVGRDKTGIRRVYYSDQGNFFVASTSIEPLLQHERVVEQVNEEKLCGFLTRTLRADSCETFYSGVSYLEPGSYLTVTHDGVDQHRYWDPSDLEGTISADREQVEDMFRKRLAAAIRSRVRTRCSPGVMMSGGLDSITIACVAQKYRKQPIQAYSIIYDEDDREDIPTEYERIGLVESEYDIEVSEISSEKSFDHISTFEKLAHGSPCYPESAYNDQRLFRRACERGEQVLLTGYGGNFWEGNRLYYPDLLRRKKVLELISSMHSDSEQLYHLLKMAIVFNIFREQTQPFINSSDIIQWSGWGNKCITILENTPLDSQDKKDAFTRLELHGVYRMYRDPFMRTAFSNIEDMAIRNKIERRHPLLDSRVVELLFSTPMGNLFDGRHKSAFRSSLEGILPEPILQIEPDWGIESQTKRDDRKVRDFAVSYLSNSKLERRGILDNRTLPKGIHEYITDNTYELSLWRLLIAEAWLKNVT